MTLALLGTLLVAQAAAQSPGPAPAEKPAAQWARAPRTVLVVPFALEGDAAEWAGFAVAEILSDAVVQENKDNFITFKQLDAVLRRRDVSLADAQVPQAAAELGRALGATDVVTGLATKAGEAYSLEARRLRADTGQVLKSARVDGPASTLPGLAQLLAVRILGVPAELAPMTTDAAALEQVARCQLEVARQPLGPRARPSLSNEKLHAVDEACGEALELDASLGLAHAGLAVALAARGNLEEAKSEAQAARAGRFVPLAALAQSWVARRGGDAAGATAALESAVAKHPGFLHALGYLGEDRSEAGDGAGALKAFDRYLVRAPGHPWATGKKARELSRLGRKAEGIALTKRALARDPGDPELIIELASRYIDAGKDALAEAELQKAMDAKPPRPLAALRLGYLYLRAGKLKEARIALKRAVREATREDESKVRATAHADLAVVAARAGSLQDAVAELRLARAEGLGKLPCAEPALAQWKDEVELAEVCGEAAGPASSDDDEDEDEMVSIELR